MSEFDRFARWALPARGNTTRGLYAEYLVARAVGADLSDPRDEWANYDVITPDGVQIEVKSAGRLQAWTPVNPTGIRFNRLITAGTTEDGRIGTERGVRAGVYVFALHTATAPEQYDVWNTDQWEYRVVRGATIAEWGQRSIGLNQLDARGVPVVAYDRLRQEITSPRY